MDKTPIPTLDIAVLQADFAAYNKAKKAWDATATLWRAFGDRVLRALHQMETSLPYGGIEDIRIEEGALFVRLWCPADGATFGWVDVCVGTPNHSVLNVDSLGVSDDDGNVLFRVLPGSDEGMDIFPQVFAWRGRYRDRWWEAAERFVRETRPGETLGVELPCAAARTFRAVKAAKAAAEASIGE